MIDAFVLTLSAFATNAMAAYSTKEAGEISAKILWAVLTTARGDEGRNTTSRPNRRDAGAART